MKYLLCRPTNGLNDMLNQIHNCIVYAKKYNRILIIDTNYSKYFFWRDKFSQYFISKSDNIFLDLDKHSKIISNLRTYPNFLNGNIHNYKINNPSRPTSEIEPNSPIIFDFNRDYDEELIVHHLGYGGKFGHETLKYLRLQKSLKKEFNERLEQLPGEFIGVHFRYTDLKSNLSRVVKKIKKLPDIPIYLATDSLIAKNEFEKHFTKGRIIATNTFYSDDSMGIHMHKNLNVDSFQINKEAILDLYFLTFSKHYIFDSVKLDNRKTKIFELRNKSINFYGIKNGIPVIKIKNRRYSGFALLVEKLRENPDILRQTL